MEVILLERVAKLGQMGETVKVRDGYARNFLLPRGKALRATKANKEHFEKQRAQLEARNLERRKEAEAVGEKLERTELHRSSARPARSGVLYGSVSTRDLAETMTAGGFSVNRDQIVLNRRSRRSASTRSRSSFIPEVEVKVTINIARSPEEAERQARGERVTIREETNLDDLGLEVGAALAEAGGRSAERRAAPADACERVLAFVLDWALHRCWVSSRVAGERLSLVGARGRRCGISSVKLRESYPSRGVRIGDSGGSADRRSSLPAGLPIRCYWITTLSSERRMAANALIARLEAVEPTYRVAPNNIDAEQALLGAILVNNDAYYRVSDFLEAGAFLRGPAPAHLRGRDEPDQGRQGRDADHAEDVPGRPGSRRRHGLAISRAPRRRGDDRHQRGGLRPHDLRPRHPPQPDRHRRGHGQRRLRRAGRDPRPATRSRRPSGGSTSSPRRAATTAASSASPRRSPAPSTWRRPPTSARASCRASPPASPTSTA